jgi:hypothetical protein
MDAARARPGEEPDGSPHLLEAMNQLVEKTPAEASQAGRRGARQMMRVAAATPPASTIIARRKR